MDLNRTAFPSAHEVERNWWIADASGETLGRLATAVADVLRGKNKPTYTPFLDTGDFVVVINAEKIAFTGKKWQNKEYAWTTGYPGQRRETAATRLSRSSCEPSPSAVFASLSTKCASILTWYWLIFDSVAINAGSSP